MGIDGRTDQRLVSRRFLDSRRLGHATEHGFGCQVSLYDGAGLDYGLCLLGNRRVLLDQCWLDTKQFVQNRQRGA